MGLTGRCMCGAVRYELESDPFDSGWCHCRTCQLTSGAPAMVFASVPEGDFVWTSGAEKVKSVAVLKLRPSRILRRVRDALPNEGRSSAGDSRLSAWPHWTSRAPLRPAFTFSGEARCRWFEPRDDLPRHDKFRPDTRGLEGTEPPDDRASGGVRAEERRGCPPAIAGSGCAARRRPSARPAGRP